MYCSTWIGFSPCVPNAITPSTASSVPAITPPHGMARPGFKPCLGERVAVLAIVPRTSRAYGASQKVLDGLRDLIRVRLQRKMSGIVEMDFRAGNVTLE